MVFWFETAKITPTLVEIKDCIDIVGIEIKSRKQEDIFIPNKPSVENIVDLFGLGKTLPTGPKNPM